jgi:hypothetical protein
MDGEYEISGQNGPRHHLRLQMAWLLLWLIAFPMLLWGIDQATFDGGMLQQAFLLLLALTGKALGG